MESKSGNVLMNSPSIFWSLYPSNQKLPHCRLPVPHVSFCAARLSTKQRRCRHAASRGAVLLIPGVETRSICVESASARTDGRKPAGGRACDRVFSVNAISFGQEEEIAPNDATYCGSCTDLLPRLNDAKMCANTLDNDSFEEMDTSLDDFDCVIHKEDTLLALRNAKGKEISGYFAAVRRIKILFSRAFTRALRSVHVKGAHKNQLLDDKLKDVGVISEALKTVSECETTEASVNDQDNELDEIPWDVLKRLWENPAFVKFRVSISMANLTMALPTFFSRALPLLSNIVRLTPFKGYSFPVLAPILFGGGLVFKSAISNLGFVLPRMMMSMAIMWTLWGFNYAIQEAIGHLKDTGSVDRRVATVLVLFVELTFSAIAVVAVLSSIGMNVHSLLLPSFLALALSGKDVWRNYFAGFFLLAAQPFRPGHTVAVLCGSGYPGSHSPPSQTNVQTTDSSWFEGVCEAVDLRYTVIRKGPYRLVVPNAVFVKREFMIADPQPVINESVKYHTPKLKGKAKSSRGESGKASRGSSKAKSKDFLAEDYVNSASPHHIIQKKSCNGDRDETWQSESLGLGLESCYPKSP